MEPIPYPSRILLLILILGTAAFVDWRRHGVHAQRWREYAFLLGCGATGAVFGLLNDALVTSSLSPEYFRFGKGISEGSGVRWRVALLGAQAGFGPAAMGAAVYLFLNTRRLKHPPLSWTALMQVLLWPLTGVLLFGAGFPILFSSFDPLGLRKEFRTLMEPERLDHFMAVWWIHGGLYSGFLIGTVLGGWALMKRRASR